MMGKTDGNDFVVLFLYEFPFPIFLYFLFNKLKILELHSFSVQAAQFFSELHILCIT